MVSAWVEEPPPWEPEESPPVPAELSVPPELPALPESPPLPESVLPVPEEFSVLPVLLSGAGVGVGVETMLSTDTVCSGRVPSAPWFRSESEAPASPA